MKRVLTIPGVAVSAMLVAGVDAYDWLNREILEKREKQMLDVYIHGVDPFKELPKEREGAPKAKYYPHEVPGGKLLIRVQPTEIGQLKLDRFKKLTKFFALQVDIPARTELEELVIQELQVEISRRVYGLIDRLSPRELEVLQKRIVERKSITKTASEMAVKPQAIVAHATSIKKKVHQHLYESELT